MISRTKHFKHLLSGLLVCAMMFGIITPLTASAAAEKADTLSTPVPDKYTSPGSIVIQMCDADVYGAQADNGEHKTATNPAKPYGAVNDETSYALATGKFTDQFWGVVGPKYRDFALTPQGAGSFEGQQLVVEHFQSTESDLDNKVKDLLMQKDTSTNKAITVTVNSDGYFVITKDMLEKCGDCGSVSDGDYILVTQYATNPDNAKDGTTSHRYGSNAPDSMYLPMIGDNTTKTHITDLTNTDRWYCVFQYDADACQFIQWNDDMSCTLWTTAESGGMMEYAASGTKYNQTLTPSTTSGNVKNRWCNYPLADRIERGAFSFNLRDNESDGTQSQGAADMYSGAKFAVYNINEHGTSASEAIKGYVISDRDNDGGLEDNRNQFVPAYSVEEILKAYNSYLKSGNTYEENCKDINGTGSNAVRVWEQDEFILGTTTRANRSVPIIPAMILDADNSGNVACSSDQALPAGNYLVLQVSAGEGYYIDENFRPIVSIGHTYFDTIYPTSGTTGESVIRSGSAVIAGNEYTVNATRTLQATFTSAPGTSEFGEGDEKLESIDAVPDRWDLLSRTYTCGDNGAIQKPTDESESSDYAAASNGCSVIMIPTNANTDLGSTDKLVTINFSGKGVDVQSGISTVWKNGSSKVTLSMSLSGGEALIYGKAPSDSDGTELLQHASGSFSHVQKKTEILSDGTEVTFAADAERMAPMNGYNRFTAYDAVIRGGNQVNLADRDDIGSPVLYETKKYIKNKNQKGTAYINEPQGDAKFIGSEFEIEIPDGYFVYDIYNQKQLDDDSITLRWTKDGMMVVDDEGNLSEFTGDYLPYGEYTLSQYKVGDGYSSPSGEDVTVDGVTVAQEDSMFFDVNVPADMVNTVNKTEENPAYPSILGIKNNNAAPTFLTNTILTGGELYTINCNEELLDPADTVTVSVYNISDSYVWTDAKGDGKYYDTLSEYDADGNKERYETMQSLYKTNIANNKNMDMKQLQSLLLAQNAAKCREIVIPIGQMSAGITADLPYGRYLVALTEIPDGYEIDGDLFVTDSIEEQDDMIEFTANLKLAEPGIYTTAVDANNGTHTLACDSQAAILDKVTYTGLRAKTTYTLRTTLADAKTGNVIAQVPMVETKITTNDLGQGRVDVNLPVNSSGFSGRKVVVFEEVYDEEGLELILSHCDPSDEKQTLEIPTLKTTLVGENGSDKTILAGTEITVIDILEYEGLVPGTTYKIESSVVAQASGAAIGTPVETEFTPDEASGRVSVSMVVDTLALNGQKVTAFETIKDNYSGATIIKHENLGDVAQTVTVSGFAPGEGEDDSLNSDDPNAQNGVPQTDTVQYYIWLICAVLALAGGCTWYIIRTRRKIADTMNDDQE